VANLSSPNEKRLRFIGEFSGQCTLHRRVTPWLWVNCAASIAHQRRLRCGSYDGVLTRRATCCAAPPAVRDAVAKGRPSTSRGALLAPIRGCRGQPACSLLQTSLIVRMLAPRGPHPPVFDPHNGLRSELYGSKPAYSSSTRLNEIEPLIWLGASARRRAEPLPAGSSGGRLVICACDHS